MGIVAAFGVIAGARLIVAQDVAALAIMVAGSLVLVLLVAGYPRLLAGALLLGCLVGGTAAWLTREPPKPAYVGARAVQAAAIVATDPEQAPHGLRAVVVWRDEVGIQRRSLMFAGPRPTFHRGDIVQVTATVDGPEAERLYATSLQLTRHAGALEERRAGLRDWLDRTVRTSVGGSEGALALGLLIGDDSALTQEEEHDVRRAGLSHITAVSGWNVTLVVASVGTFLVGVGLRGPGWVVAEVAALVGYVWLVGADAPVVRAAIMGAWVIAARQLGRPAHGPTLLALAAATMVALDHSAFGSLSFQLSIIATAALIATLRRTAGWVGWRAAVFGPLLATIAITVATAPVLAAWTGTISLVSIPANIVAGPLVPLATGGSVLVVATSWMPLLQTTAAAATWIVTHLILATAGLFASVPRGVLVLPPITGLALRGSVLLLLTVAAFMLPEGRMIAWQIDRWMARDERAAAFVTGGLVVGAIGLGALVAL